MNKQFLKFIDRMGQTSGQVALCEAIKNGYKVCCEAVSKESWQPVKSPVNIGGRLVDVYIKNSDDDMLYHETKRLETLSYELNRAENKHYEHATKETYRGNNDGSPNENGDFRCIKISGTPKKDLWPNEVIYAFRFIDWKNPNSYYSHNEKFGKYRPVTRGYYDGMADRYEYITDLENDNPVKPESYYNHSPEDRHKLRKYVAEHGDYFEGDEDYMMSKAYPTQKELDARDLHRAEEKMERAAEEAWLRSQGY